VRLERNRAMLHAVPELDGREYYVLAYVPANWAADGKFRKIQVRVKDKKLSVRAKQGYWAASLPAPSNPSPQHQ